MADTTTPAAEQGGMKKTLSLWNFFTIGFGAIIGTGWSFRSATGWSSAAARSPL